MRTQEEAIRELNTAGARDVILAPAVNNLDISALVLNLNLYVVAPDFANAPNRVVVVQQAARRAP